MITIVVPVYKVEEYLERSVDSILNQTFTDFELILVDDGSTDNSMEVLEKLKKEDDRITIIDKKNEENLRSMTHGIVIPGKEMIDMDEEEKEDKHNGEEI
mgnify:CR=1 FL=1